jgi:hypothetical protein
MREVTMLRLGRLRLSLVWPEESLLLHLTSEENTAAYEAACVVILAGGSPDAAVRASEDAVRKLRAGKAGA